MGWVSGLVVFFLIWWLTLFAVLPIGTRPNPESDSDTGWRGVPEKPRLLRKVRHHHPGYGAFCGWDSI